MLKKLASLQLPVVRPSHYPSSLISARFTGLRLEFNIAQAVRARNMRKGSRLPPGVRLTQVESENLMLCDGYDAHPLYQLYAPWLCLSCINTFYYINTSRSHAFLVPLSLLFTFPT